jgi:LysM repeat protein
MAVGRVSRWHAMYGTFPTIAQQFGVTIKAIKMRNGLTAGLIVVGQALVIAA